MSPRKRERPPHEGPEELISGRGDLHPDPPATEGPRRGSADAPPIATAEEVRAILSQILRGDIPRGLERSALISERLKAADLLADLRVWRTS